MYCINKGRVAAGALALGFAFATSQIAFFLAPLILFLPRKRYVIPLALAPLTVTVIPYAVAGLGDMVNSLFQFQLEREPYRLVQLVGQVWSHNIGLSGVVLTIFGAAIPLTQRIFLGLISTALCIWRMKRDRYLWSTILALALTFLIPQNVFYSYYHLLMPWIVVLVWRRFRYSHVGVNIPHDGASSARQEW